MRRVCPLSPRTAETRLKDEDNVAVLLKYGLELLNVTEHNVNFRVVWLGRLVIVVLVGKTDDGLHPGVTMSLEALADDVKRHRADVPFHEVGEIEHAHSECLTALALQFYHRRGYWLRSLSVREPHGILRVISSLRITEIRICRSVGHSFAFVCDYRSLGTSAGYGKCGRESTKCIDISFTFHHIVVYIIPCQL